MQMSYFWKVAARQFHVPGQCRGLARTRPACLLDRQIPENLFFWTGKKFYEEFSISISTFEILVKTKLARKTSLQKTNVWLENWRLFQKAST